RPDKTHRFTDWSRRPLSAEQMHYAVSDVTHLRDVFTALDADLKKRGRSNWVSEEMDVLTSPRTYDFHPERAWERLKTRVRKPRELAVLMEVAAARDQATLPKLEKPRNNSNGAATVELLKVLLRMTSERHAVASKVIATVDDLDQIAADDNADVAALHGWRRELFGEAALALKHGRLALAIEKGRVVRVDRD